MCAIAGILGRGNEWPKIDGVEIVAGLLQSQVHRGPDDSGVWSNGGVILGHRRLAILDLSPRGHQPMTDPPSGCAITFNGEIYNFRELRAELESLGYIFISDTDTEVLLKAYIAWGEIFVKKLDGMFAFVLCDPRRRILIFARDHIGIKPLYYVRATNGALAWASEVRALADAGLASRSRDTHALSSYLRLGSVEEPATIFRDVRTFPPAHIAIVPIDEPQKFTFNSYWGLVPFFESGGGDFAQHEKKLTSTFDSQALADVPAGIFLSAGLDSSVLATLGAKKPSFHLQAFTIDSGMPDNDEAIWATRTASALQIVHHSQRIDLELARNWIPDGLCAMDQPSSDGMNTYLVSRASRRAGMVVALSGAGADEIHAGYEHFYQLILICRFLSHGLLGTLTRGVLKLAGAIPSGQRALSIAKAYPSISAMVDEKRRFFSPEWIACHAPGLEDEPVKPTGVSTSVENAISESEIAGYLRNTLLRDSDWATMANSQELRVPFLGRQYMEYLATVPWSSKVRRGKVNKPLLAAMLPPAIRCSLQARPKTGFNLDFLALLDGPFQQAFQEAIDVLNDVGFQLNARQLTVRLRSSSSQKLARRYWSLLALGFYIRRHSLS